LVLAATLSVTLGPVAVTVHGLGVRTNIALPSDTPPQALDLDFSLQPPDGAGLAIDASWISGGGYLQYSNGHYTGALTLSTEGVTLAAFGSLDTRATGGYSLAAIISAQFQPVQLPFGFTLNGVGGLVAVHRRVDTDALRAALRGAGIDDIFFPSNPIAQAARLVGDLATYFPEAADRYVFGPAVKLGWGTPTIVTGELAVLFELPSPVRVVLLGSITTTLPTTDHPLVALNVEIVGEVDFAKKMLAIDASLVNSKVCGFPIIGDFALRMGWGETPAFVLSVGGFHSQFTPPPNFPTLRRVRIPIGADDDPRLDIQGFLALTSNTAQVGAQIELYASAGPLNLTGSVGFEALFQFSPFSFEVDLSAGVSLRRGSTVLAGVHLDGKLTGPTPWHISGEACLSCWLFDLCVPFSASFGSSQTIELPRTSIWDALQPALQDPTNWAATLPTGTTRVVTTSSPIDATAAEAAVARIEPAAALTVRQKIAPLDRAITRFAQGVPSGPSQFTITGAAIGSGTTSFVAVTDWFAPAQFEAMTDTDRLSRPGFEPMDAGTTLASDAVVTSTELVTPLEFETIIVAPAGRSKAPRYRPTIASQLLDAQTGAREPAPRLVVRGGLPEELYTIAATADLSVSGALVAPVARGVAELALAAHLARYPDQSATLVIVPVFEVAA
jgi:hypothetical protein